MRIATMLWHLYGYGRFRTGDVTLYCTSVDTVILEADTLEIVGLPIRIQPREPVLDILTAAGDVECHIG